jgi:hypothetical protein
MPYLIVCAVALLVSGVTLFSGFGLGTVLMPAFALFFPVPVAIAASAAVHLANNLFKVVLVGRKADWAVVLRFGLPGALASIAGALTLSLLGDSPPVWTYHIGERAHAITPVKLVIGVLILAFACAELSPRLGTISFDRKYLPLGGLLSGFFGGLSGNQGALRSAFLLKAGLSKEAFIGTGVVSAVLVDVARLAVYGAAFRSSPVFQDSGIATLVAAATLSAFLGSFLGARLVNKVTFRTIQLLVGVLLVLVGAGMAAGLL